MGQILTFAHNSPERGGARHTELMELLFRRGPLSRREIADGANFPYPSLGKPLQDADTFAQR
jgi:hypothetical protein